MRRVRLLLVAVVALALAGALASSAAAKTVWLCKPGKADNPCDVSLNTTLLSPTGKKLGTVSQKNEIPQGSLDGAWGKTADAAASAATQGILKLIPQTKVN